MNKHFLIFIITILSFSASAQQRFTLDQVIQRAKDLSPSAKQAETRKENRYWQYRLFKSNYNPQLVLTGNVPGINRDFSGITQPDGTVEFLRRRNSNSELNLGLNQPITATGGEVSVNSGLNRFTATTQPDPESDDEFFFKNWSANVFNVTIRQPLFAFNELKWDKRIEPLRYEESKKEYVEEMEFISRTAVELYFNFLDAQVNLQIANLNKANNDTIFNIEEGRYNIGNTSKDKLLQVQLQLLRSEQDVASADLDMQTARL
ncbi:MAG: TolC family protein, partial [Cyclobacteriaceae bacterium]